MIAFPTKVFFRRKGLAVLFVELAIIAIALMSPRWAAAAGATPSNGSGVSDSEKKFGIKIVSLRPTANGQMLDLRFQVVDPEKAKAVLDKHKKTFLLDGQTGKTLTVPVTKAGPMRQATLNPEAGRVYFTLFANPGGLVKEGSSVSLVIGDFRKDDVMIDSSGSQPASTEKPTAQKATTPDK